MLHLNMLLFEVMELLSHEIQFLQLAGDFKKIKERKKKKNVSPVYRHIFLVLRKEMNRTYVDVRPRRWIAIELRIPGVVG